YRGSTPAYLGPPCEMQFAQAGACQPFETLAVNPVETDTEGREIGRKTVSAMRGSELGRCGDLMGVECCSAGLAVPLDLRYINPHLSPVLSSFFTSQLQLRLF